MSRHAKPSAILALAAASVLVLVGGCGIGFTNMQPGESDALYAGLFEDVINSYDAPYWLWIRGAIAGDLNGDGVVDEEAVLATIQKGDPKKPGPIEAAFLAVCREDGQGGRRVVARKLLFDKNPIPGAPMPVNDIGLGGMRPLTRCRAQMIQDKTTLRESIVVYFWSEPTPSNVWYAGLSLRDGLWEENLECAMWQETPGVLVANLDRSMEASPSGYQLVFGVAAIPPGIMAKLGAGYEAPLWGHVYARNSAGRYEQADGRFADNYRQLEASWNQTYVKALFAGLPPDELAWFEYHLAMLNHFTEHPELAGELLRKAAANARDDALKAAVAKAEALLAGNASAPAD